jgi:hypothetical protein
MVSHRFAHFFVGGQVERRTHNESELLMVAHESNPTEEPTLFDRTQRSEIVKNSFEKCRFSGCHGYCA